jgi:hypothetical protein
MKNLFFFLSPKFVLNHSLSQKFRAIDDLNGIKILGQLRIKYGIGAKVLSLNSISVIHLSFQLNITCIESHLLKC